MNLDLNTYGYMATHYSKGLIRYNKAAAKLYQVTSYLLYETSSIVDQFRHIEISSAMMQLRNFETVKVNVFAMWKPPFYI